MEGQLKTGRPQTDTRARAAETAAFPFLEVSGAARNIGLQYGRKAGARIQITLENCRRYFAARQIEWSEVRAAAERLATRWQMEHPRLIEEMRAMAEGATVAPDEILAINSRAELLHGVFGRARASADIDTCTGAVALPPTTREGHLIHGQNWDWHDDGADCAVVVKVVPERGPSMLLFGEAGCLARAGLNSAGLALTTNDLDCDHSVTGEGTPASFIHRQALSQTSLGGAIETVLRAQRPVALNVMLSHREGEAFDLEVTPEQAFWVQPEDNLLVHANHFVSPAARMSVRDKGLLAHGDSLYRDSRVRRYLIRDRGRVTLSTLQAAFQDRFGAPRAVCRAPAPEPDNQSASTVATLIMDTTAQIMWVAPRPYGPHRFTEYRLP